MIGCIKKEGKLAALSTSPKMSSSPSSPPAEHSQGISTSARQGMVMNTHSRYLCGLVFRRGNTDFPSAPFHQVGFTPFSNKTPALVTPLPTNRPVIHGHHLYHVLEGDILLREQGYSQNHLQRCSVNPAISSTLAAAQPGTWPRDSSCVCHRIRLPMGQPGAGGCQGGAGGTS